MIAFYRSTQPTLDAGQRQIGRSTYGRRRPTVVAFPLRRSSWARFVWLAFVAAGLSFAFQAFAQTNFAHFEGRQTHPIGLTPDGTRLLAVNTPDARLSVFQAPRGSNAAPVLISEIPVGLEPVSLRARTDDEVWIVNELSDSVSVVSLSRRVAFDTLHCPDEPADVIFAQGKAFVSCARNNLLRVFDAATRAELGTIELDGLNPRSLAVDTEGARVYAAFQLSGNRTTVLPASVAPPPPAPTNTNLPAPPQTAVIVKATDSRVRFTVLDHDVAEISVTEQRVLRYFTDVGTSLFDLAIRPGANEVWAVNTDARNVVRFEPELRGHFVDNQVTRITLSQGVVSAFDLNPGLDYRQLPNPAAAASALAQPTGLVFTKDGGHAWLASFASDRIAKLDALNGKVLARVEVRIPPDSHVVRGPRGLVLDEGTQRLYVLNKLANSISVVDTVNLQIIAEVPAGSYDPTPQAVAKGRAFLFDARLSGNGTGSCASCHIDADRDGLAWDLGDPDGDMSEVKGANFASHNTQPQVRLMHPMKGPMMTQTLRGLAQNQLLHWRGDRATLADFNPTFRDLMGGMLLPDDDMAALKRYLDSLRHHPNPHRTLENTAPSKFNGGNSARGSALFNIHENHCAVCHVLPRGSDNNVDDARNIAGSQFIKTAPLQTVYQRAVLDTRAGATNLSGFGLLHDGTGGFRSLPTVHFYELDNLGGADFADVSAFVMTFDTGTVPAVGYQRTLNATSARDPVAEAELTVVEKQAQAGACDLIVHGNAGSRTRQYLFERESWQYRPASTNEPSLTRGQLLELLGPDDVLTFLGTLPGRGIQASIDRNENGVLDGDEEVPRLEIARAGHELRVVSTATDRGWVLEQAPSAVGPWEMASILALPLGTDRFVLDASSIPSSFYLRLRRTW